MPIQIVRNDITKMRVDAIVNAANKYLRNGGGVNGAVHKAAGPKLLEETLTLGGCRTGEAKISGAYELPCKYVIHTVGPIWNGGSHGEAKLLTECYRHSLELAVKHQCRSIAFPLISSGVFGYPKDQALKVAVDAISTYLLDQVPDNDLMVYLVLFSKDCFAVGSKLFAGIEQYIDDHYVDEHIDDRRERRRTAQMRELPVDDWLESKDAQIIPQNVPQDLSVKADCTPAQSLEDALGQIDESFSQMILRKIKEKGIKNSDCYKKANIDKKLFSKINNDLHYKPKKQTALALAVALELSLAETQELLMKAGLALSHSEKFDIIVEYFIMQGKYDIFEINEVLFYYDQLLLGSSMY